MFTFMIKVVFKNSEISGYSWNNKYPAHLDCYVEVSASTLKEAIEKVEQKYSDKSKFWIKGDESYLKVTL